MHADLRVDVSLDKPESRCLLGCGLQISEPQVIARLGALRCRDLQPATVTADLDAVVVGHRHAGAEDEDIGVRLGADRMKIDASMELLLRLREQFGGDAADVIEAITAGQPGDG